jgi:hypothetical protein
MINGALGTVSVPSFDCPTPASHCTWDDFSSLGVCASFENLTDVATADCTWGQNGTDPYNGTCVYDYPGRRDRDPKMTITRTGEDDGEGGITPNSNSTFDFLSAVAADHDDPIGGTELSLTVARANSFLWKEFVPFPTEILYIRWYFCQQTFHNVTSTPAALTVGRTTEEALLPVRNETHMPPDLNNPIFVPEYTRLTYRAESTGHNYTMMQRTPIQMFNYIGYLLSVRYSFGHTQDSVVGGVTLGNNDLIAMGWFLNQTDIARMAGDVAATLSAQLRARDPGDNANLTVLAGRATAPRTYVAVRWPWLVLPLFEAAAAAVLLGVTVAGTRGLPLVKGSAVAPLVYGLRGWEGTPGFADAGRADAAEVLDRRAARMVAALEEGDGGRLAFVRKR